MLGGRTFVINISSFSFFEMFFDTSAPSILHPGGSVTMQWHGGRDVILFGHTFMGTLLIFLGVWLWSPCVTVVLFLIGNLLFFECFCKPLKILPSSSLKCLTIFAAAVSSLKDRSLVRLSRRRTLGDPAANPILGVQDPALFLDLSIDSCFGRNQTDSIVV